MDNLVSSYELLIMLLELFVNPKINETVIFSSDAVIADITGGAAISKAVEYWWCRVTNDVTVMNDQVN